MPDLSNLKTKCRSCKKSPRNCLCYEYELATWDNDNFVVWVHNVCTEPVRGQEITIWQPRKNAKMWRRPVYIDGFGPILYIYSPDLANEVEEAINNGTFFLYDYKNREGFRVRVFERDLARRLPFLRKPRTKKSTIEVAV